MQVLIIDDSRALRRILGSMLRELGCEVREAGNGREGLAAVLTERPDAVLVDWNMPEMNGLEFVQAVRAVEHLADLPLMMVTTETEITQMSLALEAGASEYVMKPFSKECIADKLAILGVLA